MTVPLSTSLRRLAVICPSWVGDSVMCTPLLHAVREHRPQARITLIARRGIDDVLRGTPFYDSIVTCDIKGMLGPARLARAIRQSEAEAALLLPNSFRAAAGARLSGAPVRVGYARDGRGFLLTHAIAPDAKTRPIPLLDYYARLGRFALGVEHIRSTLELFTTSDEESKADALLQGVSEPFIVLNPGGNRDDKRWPAERFAPAADRLVESRGVSVVVSGSPRESMVVEAIERAMKHPVTNLMQRGVTLGSLKAVIRRAALLITNDTGPRHIAAALGTPIVTLFGPTDHRWTTLCYARERILLAEPFLPEELMADQHAKACAIEKIAVGDVVSAAQALLEQFAPEAAR